MNDDISYLARRLRLLEKKIDYIMGHLGIEFEDDSPSADASPIVLDFVRRGKALEAIKAYREETGFGLKEAKDVIDELIARHKQGML